jgi:hypothetical protein
VCDAALKPILLQNPGSQISCLNAKFGHRRGLEEDTFLRTTQSIEISDPFSEQIQNRSPGADIQSQEKRIWDNQSSSKELDN